MRPLLLPLLACLSTGCVHTHPVGMLERDARKQDREWTRAVEEAPEDGLYWVHRPEVLSVAVSAVGTFGDLVQVQAARVDSDWAYKVSSGIDENGEWHAQERERVLAEIRGSNELGLSMVKRSESRRIRAGLKPAGWAGGDAPWTCLLYTSPSPRDKRQSRMPSSA